MLEMTWYERSQDHDSACYCDDILLNLTFFMPLLKCWIEVIVGQNCRKTIFLKKKNDVRKISVNNLGNTETEDVGTFSWKTTVTYNVWKAAVIC